MVELERELMHLAEEGSAEAQGMMIYRLATLWRRAYSLFQAHDLSSSQSEWPNLRQDLVDLAGPGSLRVRLRVTKRALHVYSIFRQ